jgi:hypothetical protein
LTLQRWPFCMKVAQRPLAQSESAVHSAPNAEPMPAPVLLVAPPAPVLVDVTPVLDVAPPLPP